MASKQKTSTDNVSRRLRAPAASSSGGASPKLVRGKKRGRSCSVEEDSPAGKKMASDPRMQAIKGLSDKFDARLDKVSTREDMNEILSHVNKNSNEIALSLIHI